MENPPRSCILYLWHIGERPRSNLCFPYRFANVHLRSAWKDFLRKVSQRRVIIWLQVSWVCKGLYGHGINYKSPCKDFDLRFCYSSPYRFPHRLISAGSRVGGPRQNGLDPQEWYGEHSRLWNFQSFTHTCNGTRASVSMLIAVVVYWAIKKNVIMKSIVRLDLCLPQYIWIFFYK